MAKIKYIEFDGKEHEIEVSNGLTVMEGAIKNKIPGIIIITLTCTNSTVLVRDANVSTF